VIHPFRSTQGFTAVELLITLFVAAAFLIAGYQLFNLVIQDGGNARAESAASNVAYDYLRRYSDSATNPCTASTPLTGQSVTLEGLSELNATVTVTITCPQSDAVTISKVEAIVAYGVGAEAKSVKYATFVDKSRGATPDTDVTNGLVGRWRLNSNGVNDAGKPDGILSNGVIPTTGQSGQAGGALTFSTGDDGVTIPGGDDQPRPTTAFTLSIWVKPSTATSASQRKILGSTQGGGYSLMIGPAGGSYCPSQYGFESYISGSYRQVCGNTTVAVNTWAHIVGVYDGATEKFYQNGVLTDTLAVSGPMSYGAASVPICIGQEPSSTTCNDGNIFPGSVDDLRIYNRALSASEVLQLYQGGAK